MYSPPIHSFQPRTPPASGRGRRGVIFCNVLILHCVFVFGPLLLASLFRWISPPREVAFTVKLGGDAPSHAPEVGEPERTRPRPEPPVSRPEPPVSRPEPPVSRPEPRPVEKPPVQPAPRKPAPRKTVPRKTAPRKTTPRKTASQKPAPRKTAPRRTAPRRPSTVEEAQRQVYSGGVNNFNPNVRIGQRNTGQARGPQDNRTPQGGRTPAMERYLAGAGRYIKSRWNQPPKSLLGGELPETLIEIDVEADGRVSGSRIVRPSGVAAMDESIRRLFAVLDRVPAPPSGRVTVLFLMRTE